MKVIRSTKCSLKFSSDKKKNELSIILAEYSKVVNLFINYFWLNSNNCSKWNFKLVINKRIVKASFFCIGFCSSSSDTYSVMFTDVKVPKENKIGYDGFGFKFAIQTLEGGRLGIAALSVGIAQGALDLSVQYSKERKTFGKPIGYHQSIAFKLSDMAVKIKNARNLVLKCAWLKDNNQPYGIEKAMAKQYAADIAMEVTTEAVQIHGGYGYVKEYHVERLMRDAKLTQIYEGTSEVQKIIISRNLLK